MAVTDPRRRPGLLVLAVTGLLPLAGCLDERLLVEITTVVRSDGSCSRRIEYRLEHFDGSGSEAAPVALAPEKDGLRLFHRFPTRDPWTVRDEPAARLHTLSAEAVLPSPNDIGSDYWRALSPRVAPARNHVSFAMQASPTGSVYDYAETLVDPASPLASLRLLARLLQKREDEFAAAYTRARGGATPLRGDVRRAYRERLARPFAAAVTALAERPVYGPRERQETEQLMDRLADFQKDLAAALASQSANSDLDGVAKSIDDIAESWSEPLDREMAASGLPLSAFGADPARHVRIRATLAMPGPILRANTCVTGDTATWEFEGEDLYGRGFEMWAKAASP